MRLKKRWVTAVPFSKMCIRDRRGDISLFLYQNSNVMGNVIPRLRALNPDPAIRFKMCIRDSLYCTHDLLKNTTALFGIRAGLRALYEYGPYGNIVRREGNAAEDNPFRFSSEYADDELGLVRCV